MTSSVNMFSYEILLKLLIKNFFNFLKTIEKRIRYSK